MTSQFINTDIGAESGFRAWHFEQPYLGSLSVLLEQGEGELRSVLDSDQISLVAEFNRVDDQHLALRNWHVAARKEDNKLSRLALLTVLDIVFAQAPQLRSITMGQHAGTFLPAPLLQGGSIHRAAFYQWPELWWDESPTYPAPVRWTESEGVRHPVRKPQPEGEFYRRFIPDINKTLSLRVVDPEQDLDLFHEWMNQRRIAPIWELGLPKPELKNYLLQREQDPHIFSVFGYFDDEPFGYFELYWTLEDRLGPYYDAGDFDRGIHLLVGNTRYLGTAYFNAWFTGLAHYFFLDDPRTMRVMGEPRADNKALLRHMSTVPAITFLKEFDFPHKRAALLEINRDRFFDLTHLP